MDKSNVETICYLPPFNPLDKINLGESIIAALEQTTPVALGKLTPFYGAGVYALYYFGSFPLYQPLVNANKIKNQLIQPIYVGKASPRGGRKGKNFLLSEPGIVLYQRLNEHSMSISEASNLDIKDFQCRFLPVEDIWISLAERLLITKYAPIWNVIIEGFGNHNPGKGRTNQQISMWDVLHPGRKWTAKLKDSPRSREEIEQMVCEELKKYNRI